MVEMRDAGLNCPDCGYRLQDVVYNEQYSATTWTRCTNCGWGTTNTRQKSSGEIEQDYYNSGIDSS